MRGLKCKYQPLNWTLPNRIALNQTKQSQTKACIAKSSCEICILWDVTQCRVIIPYQCFGTSVSSIFKGQQMKKREQTMTGINWHKTEFPDCFLYSHFVSLWKAKLKDDNSLGCFVSVTLQWLHFMMRNIALCSWTLMSPANNCWLLARTDWSKFGMFLHFCSNPQSLQSTRYCDKWVCWWTGCQNYIM